MKKIFVLIGCFWFSSAFSQVPEVPAGSSPIEGSWVLVPVLASDTATGMLPSIQFMPEKKTFTGFNGCNKISGHFQLLGNRLLFNQHNMLTKKLCEGYNEKPFMDNLLRTTRYTIEGGMLILLDGQTPLSKWKRQGMANML